MNSWGNHGSCLATSCANSAILPIARALKSREAERNVAFQHPGHRPNQSAEQLPVRKGFSDCRSYPNLVGILGFPRPRRPTEPGLEVGRPGLKLLVENLEENRLAAVAVAQHVGLGQSDAVGQFTKTDVGHVLLNQHFPRAGHDRRTARRHLFGPASALKRHGSKVSDRWALVIRPLVRYCSVIPPI